MSRPCSILLWRDARTDPRVFGDAMREVFVRRRGVDDPERDVYTAIWLAKDVARDRGNVTLLWADLPVVSDLTVSDVRTAVRALAHAPSSLENLEYTIAYSRLRAALGEKEET